MDAALVASLAAFSVAALLLSIAPGLDTALVLRTAASEGSRPALAAILGICLGCLVWAALVALGLGALLAASSLAYTVLKWTGAAYLVWLGIQLILKPRSRFELGAGPEARRGAAGWFARGFLTNILNPKVGVFYVSFLPQFIPAGVPVAPMVIGLGVIHALIGTAWLSLLVLATRPITRLLRRPAILKGLDRATGLVFVGFGLRLALDRR
jgi:threonine/homoserine/homoserine lactone efflux protein